MFFACAVTFCLGLAGAIWSRGDRRVARVAAAALAAAIVPPLGAWIIYSFWMPASVAVGSISGGWQYINKPFVSATPFYKSQLGADHLDDSLRRLLLYAGLYVAAGIFLGIFAWISGKLVGGRRFAAMALGLLLAAGTCGVILRVGDGYASFWPDAARGFPLFAVAAVIATGLRLIRRGADGGRRTVLQWTLAVLSLALLAKIFFNVRIYHYGFVLAAPCGLLAVVALLNWFPARVRLWGGSPVIAHLGALGLLAAVVIEQIILTRGVLQEHTLAIPLALGGTAYIKPIDANAAVAIRWLRAHPGTVAVLPDAAGMNYAAGRINLVRYADVNPMVLAMDGEQNVLRDFAQKPPDFILLMSFDESAFGPRWLGVDYGVELFRWIQTHYRSIGIFEGERPIQLCRHIGT
jgi:hypothetical protein